MRKLSLLTGAALLLRGTLCGQSPAPTPAPYSAETLADLPKIQAAALNSDYGYRQVAHLADNIGPRRSGAPCRPADRRRSPYSRFLRMPSTIFLASPNSIMVLSWKKRSFSTPA